MASNWRLDTQTGNNGALLCDIIHPTPLRLLNIRAVAPTLRTMKQITLSLALTLACTGAAQAACFADYKAKQDNPLRLHYGVAEISGQCARASAQSQLRARLAANGWTLLQVLSVFDAQGLDQRKNSAGQYYLRF